MSERVITVRGEWWFIGGQATFADGDIGDVNHMAVVYAQLYSEFYDDLAAVECEWLQKLRNELGPDGSNVDGGFDQDEFRQIINDSSDAACKAGLLTEEQCDDIYRHIGEQIGWDEDKLGVLTGNSDTCARAWASKHWGWVRCSGNDLEVWNLNKAALTNMADGLYDAEPDLAPHAKLTINERSTNKVYDDVPLAVLQQESMAALRPYFRHAHTQEATITTFMPR